jgi:cell division protein FtsI (penicillin-binding protein 3)
VTTRVVNRRIRLLFVLLALALAGTLARAVWLQGVRAEPLSRLAATQQRQTLEIPARRGTIFDRNGVPLALGEQATTVYADPTQITNAKLVAVAAERALGIDAEELYPSLADRSRAFVYLRRKADPAAAEKLARAGLNGCGGPPGRKP